MSAAQGVVCVDGALLPLAEARVPVLDRGFLYGDAVFEALRTFRGAPDALDAHLSRLLRSCEIVGIEPGFGAAVVHDDVQRALSEVAAPEKYIRILVTRGDIPDGLPPLGPHRARRVVIARPLQEPPAALYTQGLSVASCVAPPSVLSAGAKPAGYLNNMLALARAKERGAADALLLGAAGELLEGATSSLFLVKDGALWTPPLGLGILPGITRDRVLQAARDAGLAAGERLLFIHDAYRADELFLTSSVRQVVAVVEVDGYPVANGRPGPLTQRVAQAYRRSLGLDPA
jgi:branched-chain amino acid aminotransferase